MIPLPTMVHAPPAPPVRRAPPPVRGAYRSAACLLVTGRVGGAYFPPAANHWSRTMRHRLALVACVALAFVAMGVRSAQSERIKDLADFGGVRVNQLAGYGVVVGLNGTGDDNLEYTMQSVKSAAARLGAVLPAAARPGLKNAAAVMITAELPAFAKPGQRLDVTVAAIGKAKSLRGGTLLMAALQGADGATYAIAQGSLAVGGLGVEARDGSKVTINVPSSGRIPDGATVERAVETGFASTPTLTLNLKRADYTDATRAAAAINTLLGPVARALDAVSIEIAAPRDATQRITLMSRIEAIEVLTDLAPARVIVNARTGTIVINGGVRVSPAAVAHGNLTVRISEDPFVSQPEPLSRGGRTVVVPDSAIEIDQEPARAFVFAPGVALASIVDAVNRVGASPSDLVAILEALKQAGALKAELIVI